VAVENSCISGKELVESWLKEENDLVRFTLGAVLGVEMGRSAWLEADCDSLPDSTDGRRVCNSSGLDSLEGKNRSQFSIIISITSLQNLMSMIEATVSSRGRRRVGPKQTPMLEAFIRFCSCLAATLLRWRISTFRISRLARGSFTSTR
jgi:hypothetical protein